MSITSCSAAGLTSTDVNTFGSVFPLGGLWVPKGENCQLWASPSWAVMPGSPGELRFHVLSECRSPGAGPGELWVPASPALAIRLHSYPQALLNLGG